MGLDGKRWVQMARGGEGMDYITLVDDSPDQDSWCVLRSTNTVPI